ncbi:MAG: phosphotransferase [Chloroflexi bacterium]|nr:MAG: phosphotransferase [Chloroflexota bacterium]RLC94797.1 MAG: phosphotransferase [Chloroflexota bacterium]
MLKADLHVHTEYSFDCGMSLESIINRCLRVGVNCVAVADHGTVAGGLKMKEIAPFKVVVGEEILTPIGEIMGLFLKETVPSGVSPEEAIAQIREQNGLVCLPHPFDYMRGINQKYQSIDELAQHVDVVEVFNARALPIPFTEKKARSFAEKHGLLCSAGSDAHTLHEIGRAYVEMPEFNSVDEFRAALAQGRINGRHSCPLVHIPSTCRSISKSLKSWGGKSS